MLLAIARFEAASRLRRISTYVYFASFFAMAVLLTAASGGAFPGAVVSFGRAGKALINSPYALHAFTTLLSNFGVAVTAGIVGRSLYQDFEHDSYALFFTKPIHKLDYLGGRFLGSMAIMLAIFSSVGLGLFVGSHWPGIDASRVGPTIITAYLLPYATSILPNLFFSGTIFFALAALTRRMMPLYAASMIMVVGYIAANVLVGDLDNRTVAALVDPFGATAARVTTEYWTTAERNTRLVHLSGFYLANRLLWMVVATAIAVFAYRRFRFAHLPPAGGKRAATVPPPTLTRLPMASQRFGMGAQLGNFGSLLRLSLRETFKNPYFINILLSAVLFVFSTAGQIGKIYGTRTYPVTYAVLEVVHGTFSLFCLILITFFSGELIWREREARIDQIVDALPVPSAVTLLAKLAALMSVLVLLVAIIAGCGITIQLVRGYTHLELALYAKELFLIRLVDFWLLCVLAIAVHVIINQKYLGHFVMVLYYAAAVTMPLIGLEHNLFIYGAAPEHTYSDMNGYGHFVQPIFWFRVYWAAGALALALLSRLLWVRGTTGSGGEMGERLKLARARLTPSLRLGLGAALVAFVALGGFIFNNTNVRNRYRTATDKRHDSATYERTYKGYETLPQPRVTAVQAAVDLFPDERRAAICGTLDTVNQTAGAIESLFVNLAPPARLRRLAVDGRSDFRVRDERLGVYVLGLAKPLAPGQSSRIDYEVDLSAHGFTNGDDPVRVYGNGTFFDSGALPSLGYRAAGELIDDDERRKEGLKPKERMPDLDDLEARKRSALDGAPWVTFDATLSTSPDQLAVAPGKLVGEWSSQGRRYFHYQTQTRTLDFFAFLSARYQVVRDRWHDIAIEIDYHRGHEYDLAQMIDGVKQSLDYYTQHFGPYQFDHVRILEFPRYARFAQSFANTIPYSESIGFIAKVDPKDEDDVDYPFYVTAHEVAHQWWAHQVIGADVQGAALLTETLAQYSALMVMKHQFGAAQMKRFLKYELDRYLQDRGQERKKELPLYRVETQPYIYYQKGSLVMYALQDYLGEEAVDAALARLLAKHKFEEGVYATSRDLLAELRAAAPPQYQRAITDLFEDIVLYQNRALKATYQREGDRYRVRVSVAAKKLQADGQGREHEVPLDDWIDVGVLDAKGTPIALERRHVTEPQMELSFLVDQQPARAGIDPLVKLIDRKWEDNTIKVERE
jgi:hypothetical protein